MNVQIEIQLIAIVVALACSTLGVFLILRKMAMMADAIGHTILFGIVVAFFITHDLNSPLLVIGAALTGTLTVFLVESINKTKLVSEDSSIGLIFPLLFSIGVILISLYAGDVHLDTDSVLLGEIAFAPFNRFVVNGVDIGPSSLYVMGTILIINIIYVSLFYKELKISTFDPGLAMALGISPGIMHYSLMTLVSLTAVGAFDAVGAILVVAFMVGPPTAAYLLTDDLKDMIFLSGIIGTISVILGYWTARIFDVAIAGMMAVMVGVMFLLIFFFAPDRGLLSIMRRKKRQKYDFAQISFLMHVINHEGAEDEREELGKNTIHEHLDWNKEFAKDIFNNLYNSNLVYIEDDIIKVTEKGRDLAISNAEDIVNGI